MRLLTAWRERAAKLGNTIRRSLQARRERAAKRGSVAGLAPRVPGEDAGKLVHSVRQALATWRHRALQYQQAVGRALIALVAAAMGLTLGKLVLSPRWSASVTGVGMTLHILLIVVNPVLGFLTWIVTSPFGPFTYQVLKMGSGVPDLTLNRVGVAVLVLLVLAQIATGLRKGVGFGLVGIFGLIYVLSIGLATTISLLGRVRALQSWFDGYVVPFLVYLLAKNLISNRHDLRTSMHTLLIVGLYLSGLAIHEQTTGVVWFYPEDRSVIYTADVRRVVGLLGNPGFIALTINMATPFVAYLFVTSRSVGRKLFYGAVLAVFGAGVFMCYNRSGWVGFALGLLVMAIFSSRFRKYYVPALVVAGVILAVAGTAILANPRIAQRLFAQGPIEYRLKALSVAWQMLHDYFWSGVGFSNYEFYYTRYAYWDPYLRALPTPHNSYLSVALMAGFPIGICYILMYAFYWVGTGRLYLRADESTFPDRTMIAAAWGAAATYIWAGMTMDTIFGFYPTTILSLIMGMTLGAWQGRVIPALAHQANR